MACQQHLEQCFRWFQRVPAIPRGWIVVVIRFDVSFWINGVTSTSTCWLQISQFRNKQRSRHFEHLNHLKSEKQTTMLMCCNHVGLSICTFHIDFISYACKKNCCMSIARLMHPMAGVLRRRAKHRQDGVSTRLPWQFFSSCVIHVVYTVH